MKKLIIFVLAISCFFYVESAQAQNSKSGAAKIMIGTINLISCADGVRDGENVFDLATGQKSSTTIGQLKINFSNGIIDNVAIGQTELTRFVGKDKEISTKIKKLGGGKIKDISHLQIWSNGRQYILIRLSAENVNGIYPIAFKSIVR